MNKPMNEQAWKTGSNGILPPILSSHNVTAGLIPLLAPGNPDLGIQSSFSLTTVMDYETGT